MSTLKTLINIWKHGQRKQSSNLELVRTSKRRSSLQLASSIAQFARVSSGLAVFKRSTRYSIKGFNSLLTEVSEHTGEDVEDKQEMHIPNLARQANESTILESDKDIKRVNIYRRSNSNDNRIKGMFGSPDSNSVFKRFFKWRQSSCEDKIAKSKLSNSSEGGQFKNRSLSEEQLLDFMEKHPNYEGQVQIQRKLGYCGSNPTHLGISKTHSVSNKDDVHHFRGSLDLERTTSTHHKEIEYSDSSEIIELRSTSYTKCRSSAGYGEEMRGGLSQIADVSRSYKSTCPEPLHKKLQRYKTFHGSARGERPREHQKSFMLQVAHQVINSARLFPLCTATILRCYTFLVILSSTTLH